MRYLHVIGTLDVKSGGTYTALITIMKMLDRIGHENYVASTISPNQSFDTSYFETRSFLFETSFPKRYRKSLSFKKWLTVNIANYDILIVHEIWGGMGLDTCMIANKNNIPYHIWPHGSLDPFDLIKKKYLKKFIGFLVLREIMSKAQYICCTSKKEMELLVYFGKKVNNSVVLPLPVDYYTENTTSSNSNTFRSKFNIESNAFVMLFLSRINYKKGLDILIDSFGELLTEGKISKKTLLVIAGDDTVPYKKVIDTLIAKKKINNNVIFTGLLTGEMKQNAFKESNIFVLPSKNENFGLAIIEALQMSLPILITKNVYICDDLFNEMKPGWIFESLSTVTIKATLEDSINSNDLASFKIEAKKTGQQFTSTNLEFVYKKIYKEN